MHHLKGINGAQYFSHCITPTSSSLSPLAITKNVVSVSSNIARTSVYTDEVKLSEQKKEKVVVAELMSSEESDEDTDAIIVKPLPWRSERVSRFFYRQVWRIKMCKLSDNVRGEF